jgi:hypothetical protein
MEFGGGKWHLGYVFWQVGQVSLEQTQRKPHN